MSRSILSSFFYQVILNLNCVPFGFSIQRNFCFFHLNMNAGIFRQINDSGSHRDDGVTEDKFVAGVLLKEK
jgi:hypothetical protein